MKIEDTTDSATEIRASGRPTNLKTGLEPLAAFAEEIRQLDLALSKLADLGDANTGKSVARLRQTLGEFEPSVTLLGQVKSGKTSLVNAMAGWADLLPADVNPWTSVVTSLHLTPEAKRVASGAKFRFFAEDEWDRLLNKGGRIGELADRAGADSELQKIREQIEAMREKSKARLGRKFELLLGQEHEYSYFDKNLVERYICLGDHFDSDEPDAVEHNQGRFADITKSADLFLHCDTLPSKLCIRDTPGVNDTFMMREQVTIRAIRDSRLCVVVLSAHQALTSVDMAVIRLISNLKSRDVIIFVNRIDELEDPVRQVPEIRDSILQTLKDQNGPTDASILFGSAYWANRVLAGDLENMSAESTATLLNWAENSLSSAHDAESAPNMVWELSGLPALYRALSERIVEDHGQETLNKISRSAINIANSLQVAEAITITGAQPADHMDRAEIETEFSDLAHRHIRALNSEFDKLIKGYHKRADRAHGNFLDRATHSLITHLEKWGENQVWEYNPTGLRMLLRSAYNVFGTRTQATTETLYEAAAADIAVLYGQAFGGAVDGIGIEAPITPHIPPPVCLGQTIALDFQDGWWKSWWRRRRGYQAYAESFQEMIRAETSGILTELKYDQADAVRDSAKAALREFLDEQRSILAGLVSKTDIDAADAREAFDKSSNMERRRVLESTMEALSRCAA